MREGNRTASRSAHNREFAFERVVLVQKSKWDAWFFFWRFCGALSILWSFDHFVAPLLNDDSVHSWQSWYLIFIPHMGIWKSTERSLMYSNQITILTDEAYVFKFHICADYNASILLFCSIIHYRLSYLFLMRNE